jgi:hypothetical protein
MNRLLRTGWLLMLSVAFAAAQEHREYNAVQMRLARGWNTWDVHSVTTQVLLPDGLAIRIGFKHVTQLFSSTVMGFCQQSPAQDEKGRGKKGKLHAC